MKLIIDIPDRIHYAIELGITVNGSDASQMLIDAVKNGIPLDDIREEILSIGKYEEYRELMPNFELEQVIKIIDKYRGESDCHSCKTEYDCYECKKYEESEAEDGKID